MRLDTIPVKNARAPRRGPRYLIAVAVIAMGMCLGACKSRAQPGLDEAISVPDGAPRDAIVRTAETLVAALAAQGPTDAVTFDVRDLGEGLYTVRAFQMGSYPGTGNASAVVSADGRSFGSHGEHDLAELVRERGWLASPPPSERLLRLVDAAYFEGHGSTSPSDPAMAPGPDGLELRFERFMPPGPSHPWRVIFPPEGPTRVETRDASDPERWIRVLPR